MSIIDQFKAMQDKACASILDAAFTSSQTCTRHFVWFLPNKLQVEFGPESPGPEWEILTGQPIPTHFTKEQLSGWLVPLLRRAPLLPLE